MTADKPYSLEQALEDSDLGALAALRRADRAYQAEYAVTHLRHMSAVMSELEGLACANQEVAESCYYSVPRSGSPLQGPSIRFAELLAYCMPNTEVTTEFITVNNDEAVSRGRFVDAERNRVIQADARRPVYKKRYKDEPDQDDKKIAYEVAAALAFRNVMFKAVPRALWEPVYRQVLKVADGKMGIDERRRLCIETFEKKGATADEVLAAVGREAESELTIKDMRHLKGMLVAMRDGVLTLADALRPREKDGQVKPSGMNLGQRMSKKPEPEPEHDESTGEVVEVPAEPTEEDVPF